MMEGFEFGLKKSEKTYFAIRHEVKRAKQKEHDDSVHHPDEKAYQIAYNLPKDRNLEILELFSGGEKGNLTPIYKTIGNVQSYDKRLGTGDSFKVFHRLIAEGKKFDVVDLDPYGFPNRMFPDVYLLIEKGWLVVTFPFPSINILNSMTKLHFQAYFGEESPSFKQVVSQIVRWGLCHWRKVELIDSIEIGRLWRMLFYVEKVNAQEYISKEIIENG